MFTPDAIFRAYEDGSLPSLLRQPTFCNKLLQTQPTPERIIGTPNHWRWLVKTPRFQIQTHPQHLWGMEVVCRTPLPKGTIIPYDGILQRTLDAKNDYIFALGKNRYLNPLANCCLGTTIAVLFNDDHQHLLEHTAKWLSFKAATKKKGVPNMILFMLAEDALPGDVCITTYGSSYHLPKYYVDHTQSSQPNII